MRRAVRLGPMATIVVAAWVLGTCYAAHAEDEAPVPRMEWSRDWPRFRLSEYATSAAVGASSWYIRNYRLPPAQGQVAGRRLVRRYLPQLAACGRTGRPAALPWLLHYRQRGDDAKKGLM